METLVLFGTEVKAYDDGRVDGYLVRFGEPDASKMRDVFTKATDFDINPESDRSTVLYHHGMDPVLKRKRLGTEKAEIGVDDTGVWIKGQLNLRDKYEAAIHQLAKEGKLGWSSGVPGHLVERKAIDDNAHLVTLWPLGKDASLTPIPADPRNVAGVGSIKSIADIESMSLEDAIKSLLKQPEAQTPEALSGAVGAANDGAQLTETKKMEVQVMSEQNAQQGGNPPPAENAMKTELDLLKSKQDATSKNVEQILKYMEDSPYMRKSGYYSVDGGTADANIKTAGDMLLSIQRGDSKRLLDHYALKAQVEADGTRGGWYVGETVMNDLFPGLMLTSGVGQLVRRIKVSTPSGSINMIDYTRSLSDNGQSASSGGVSGKKRAEGGAYQETTLYFSKVRWDVSDFCSGKIKASKELMSDAPIVESMIRSSIEEDVSNKEEYGILQGSGAGEPLGVLNWIGTVGIDEDTDNTFAIADSDEMVSRLLKKGPGRIAWAHHPGVYTDVAGFERGTGGAVYQSNIQGALATALHGYPRFDPQHMPAQGSDGYVVLGNWWYYLLFELGGLYIDYSEHADFENGNVMWRFGKRIDGRPVMTNKVTMADGSFTVSPFVKLDNKT